MSSFATPRGTTPTDAARSLNADGAERTSNFGLPREPSEGRWNTGLEMPVWCPESREGFQHNDSKFFSESLILAQNERWQRGLGMQVERDQEGSYIGL